jgi:hypothetical protein
MSRATVQNETAPGFETDAVRTKGMIEMNNIQRDEAEGQQVAVKNPLSFGNFFSDPNWRPFAFQRNKQFGAYPNRLYFNEKEKLGVAVAFRGAHESWAINEGAINHLRDAVSDGRIGGGHVILAIAGNPAKVVSAMEIMAVAKLLASATCRDGHFGRYWWVYEQFATDQSAELADAPF